MNYLIDDLFGNVEMKPTRNGFGEGLVELGERNEKVVVLCADLRESVRVDEFAKKFPDKFVEVGVAEQNMIGVAAGMALEGMVPFAASYAVFSPGRSWDQIRVSVAYTNANVKIVGGHAGVSVGADGATHQAMADIALMRVLPHMMVVVPCDAVQAKKATLALAELKGPAYLRISRPKTAVFTERNTPFEIGKAQILREGRDLTIVGCGPILYAALMASEELKGEIDIEVINMHTIKPLDEETLVRSARKTGKVLTVEDHQINGGLGGAVAEVLAEQAPTKMLRVGMRDVFGESGDPDELLKKYEMDKEGIVKAVRKLL
jgi:transketolase